MVQGKTKGLQSKASSSRHAAKAAANTKKGKKYIPPKKPTLIKQAAMHKVRRLLQASCNAPSILIEDLQNLSAKINKSIEQQMVSAASAGKLTIMKNATSEPPSSSKTKS
ncbi:hypothetical protein ONZ45_g1587 [Pleurotus djamor]|nr:hypothetical protein ONZ45_g1587 [Pleurotus djamor]